MTNTKPSPHPQLILQKATYSHTIPTMLEFYTIVSTIILSITNILFFVKWRIDAKIAEKVKEQSDLREVICEANLGGHYYWNKKAGTEFFSINLIKVCRMKKKVSSFSQIARLFGDDRKILTSLLLKLQNGEQDSFLYTGQIKTTDGSRHIQCFGNRVDDNEGNVSGVVVWFYDVSEYAEQISNLKILNRRMKTEIRDYVRIFNSIPIPIWLRDNNFAVQRCNLTYSRIVSNDLNEVSETHIPELDENLISMSKLAVKNKNTLNMKKHFVLNGERRFFEISERAVAGANGTIGFACDITKQEDIEKELARHISAHGNLLESSSSAVAIYGPDTNLKFYNNAFVKLWNLDEEWLNTHPSYGEILELLRERRQLPEQADFNCFRKEQMKLFKELVKPHDDFFYLPDGTALRIIVIPHALGGLLFAYEDMTDHFAMERSYNTLIAVQKETLDHLREGVAVFGRDGVNKLYNPQYAEMWPDEIKLLQSGASNAELLEKSKHLFNYGKDWKAFKEDWLQLPTTKTPIVKRVERTDGRVIDKLVVPLPDGDFLLSYEDVTDTILAQRSLRERNEALEAADNLKTNFLANVSYELRTPLTSIVGFSEVLESKTLGKLNAKQEEYVKNIHNASDQLMSIINDILDLSSLEAGYLVLETESFNIHTALSAIVDITKESCKNAGLKISLKCPKRIGSMIGDERRIKRIMLNIIGNSIKFTEEGGNITVGASATGDKIKIWVSDTGIGIKKAEGKSVFNKFFKTDDASSMRTSGTGLGLSIVKNIVELHGGKVEIESKLGKGTTVICYFHKDGKKM